jgi:CRISPR associated protein Cas1
MTSVSAFFRPGRVAFALIALLFVCIHAQAQDDPLPSWNDGPAKQAIVELVKVTTDKASSNFVAPEARIATFDQDGTTWVEHPMYTQVIYCLERVPALMKTKPELKQVEPFKTVLSPQQIGQRTSILHLTGNRNASHPVNAILNYAYTVLQSGIQINAISKGYDLTIGIMHEGSDGSAAFVFDLMEPHRPLVDRRILEFVKGHVFHSADFIIRSDGVCRLNPEMAQCVVGLIAAN